MNRNVVISGAGGFLGGHLVDYFLRQGWTVLALFHKESEELALQTTKRQIQQEELLTRIPEENQTKLTLFEGDITDKERMRQLFHDHQPDTLIHAAARSVPPKETDYKNSALFAGANERFVEINQATVLADCVAEYQAIKQNFYSLLVSTIYVFNTQAEIITEQLPHEPPINNLYAISKDDAQKYWESDTLNLNLGVIFPPQIYGPYQFTSAIMPRLIRKLLFNEGDQLTLSGEMNPIHINNLLQLMYALCLHSGKGNYCVNGDEVMTLAEIAYQLQQASIQCLKQHGVLPFPEPAFAVSEAPAAPALKIDDSKLIGFFRTVCPNPSNNPHQPIPFETTAEEMVIANWNHGNI